ncbi:hypothetical protein EGT71_09060 [Atlantibacter subterranea]|uniref:Uncharacterized protein n=1 Tax=Atlantibacter subterraneus TaxID=255519 RepID=A0A3R9GAU0_9ENTR|nr:hypothetical protein [Atlantibacter subterranea]RSB62780.1 hypothetical protein EGK67_10875 [Atlantibacter subterranea]RSE01980.1 hypothetical protein EGT84_20455 [Atlantibacter subterranea]RSE26571.1 hypothetical protein EGT71_09060 [Atlantibacter subterranea]
MKDMTHKQLIRAAYVVAKLESAQTAQLLTELAGRLDGALVAARTACLERDASVRAEIEWEKAMMQAVGEDGVGDVVQKIEKLKAERDALAVENGEMKGEPVAKVLSSRAGNDTSTIDKALPAGTALYTLSPVQEEATTDEVDEEIEGELEAWND